MGIFIGALAVVLNFLFVFLLLSSERRSVAKGTIPPRGEILYLQDLNFFKWGDRWFLSIMDFAIAFVLVERWPLPIWVVTVCFLVGIAWTALWHRIYLGPRQIPNSLYPYIGAVSLVGRIHLAYFAAQYILGFMGIAMVVLMIMGERQWSPAVFVAFVAGFGYFATLISDFVAKRYRL
ncbi:MAG: hypothetical protein KJI69_01125 [Patescibacteria group bacterium]|nr:hypothetical protein [Patescibacteria group bacterium]